LTIGGRRSVAIDHDVDVGSRSKGDAWLGRASSTVQTPVTRMVASVDWTYLDP
jgi:hypothetical protein